MGGRDIQAASTEGQADDAEGGGTNSGDDDTVHGGNDMIRKILKTLTAAIIYAVLNHHLHPNGGFLWSITPEMAANEAELLLKEAYDK